MKKYKKVIPYIISLACLTTINITILIGIDYALTHDIEELNQTSTIAGKEITYKDMLILLMFNLIVIAIYQISVNLFSYLLNKIIKGFKEIKR